MGGDVAYFAKRDLLIEYLLLNFFALNADLAVQARRGGEGAVTLQYPLYACQCLESVNVLGIVLRMSVWSRDATLET